MNITDIFRKANETNNIIFEKSIEHYSIEIGKTTELIDCYRKVLELDNHTVTINETISDFFTSIQFCLNGLYRNSFISLRCGFEMGLYLIYFFDNNYHYNLWKKNQFDILWSNLKNQDCGILTDKYLSLYNENNEYEDFIESVSSIYRETSEYVHGKYEYIESFEKNIFNERISSGFIKTIQEILEILIVFVDIRFKKRPDEYVQLIQECYKNMELDYDE